MAKAKTTAFFCKECGYESAKWMGQCPACREWNTMVEEPVGKKETSPGAGRRSLLIKSRPALLSEISVEEKDRVSTGYKELDQVLGGGVVAGSLVLVGGDPGIGKSTLLLQVCRNLAIGGQKVLYISGEESLKQIKLRANRIGSVTGDLKFLCETSLDHIRDTIGEEKPDIVIIDSIQTMYREEVASAAVGDSAVGGTSPLLLEVQALVTQTNLGIPRRTAAGTDHNRVNLLMAVLEKRCHYEMSRYDAYVNIAGGMKMNEPALDLAIIMALVSSLKDRPVDAKTIVWGEVGLSGEVRAVSMAEQRVNEAVKLGFEACILPQICLDKMKDTGKIRLIGVRNVREAIGYL